MVVDVNGIPARLPAAAYLGPGVRHKQTGHEIRFSDLPMAAAILLKPAVDALYSYSAVKYGYMGFIFFAAFFSLAGHLFADSRGMGDQERTVYTRHLGALGAYTVFLFVLLAAYLGSFSEIFKILSPFILFVLLAPVAGLWIVRVVGLMSLATILANAVMLGLDQGWVYWGDIKTFRGLYYFKTDLAYALVFASLGLALWQRFRFTPVLVVGMTLAAVQIVLANSRLNYLLFAMVVLFVLLKGGVRPLVLARNAVLVGVLALIAVFLYDPNRLLGFDLLNTAKFTQGRNQIWDILIEQGILNYSALEFIFGRGLFADMWLFAENVFTGVVHNAHNEWLHLVITQGLFGTALYLALWVTLLQFVRARQPQPWVRGLPTLSIALIVLQSMTAVVSSFATKTWPLVFLLLAASATRWWDEEGDAQ